MNQCCDEIKWSYEIQKIMDCLTAIRDGVPAELMSIDEMIWVLLQAKGTLEAKAMLCKFLPGFDLPDGRYLMDDTFCVSVKNRICSYIRTSARDFDVPVSTTLCKFWVYWDRPVYGVLPLEGQEE